MTVVRETILPGVGVRHEFTSDNGSDMAVIVHHDGRREIIAYDAEDPDACTSLANLSEHDTQTLAELLGVSHVTETVEEVRQEIEGVAIDWMQLSERCAASGTPIGAGEFRTKTGASIVAILRNDEPVPAPEADFVMVPGDVIVAVGPPAGLTQLRALIEG